MERHPGYDPYFTHWLEESRMQMSSVSLFHPSLSPHPLPFILSPQTHPRGTRRRCSSSTVRPPDLLICNLPQRQQLAAAVVLVNLCSSGSTNDRVPGAPCTCDHNAQVQSHPKLLLTLRATHCSRAWCTGMELRPFLSQREAYTPAAATRERNVRYLLLHQAPL